MAFLLDWWSTGNNYRKYRGKNNKGTKKMRYCESIATECNKISRCKRTANSVRAKIMGMEQSWRKAHDWAGETGQGVKDTEGQFSFEEGVKSYCSFYFFLHNVMVDRCSSRPAATTETLYNNDDEMLVLSSGSFSSGDDFTQDRDAGKKTKTTKKTKDSPICIIPRQKDLESKYGKVFDSETLILLRGTNQVEKEKLQEAKRHNLVVEDELGLKAKKARHDYKMQLVKDFQELKRFSMPLEDFS